MPVDTIEVLEGTLQGASDTMDSDVCELLSNPCGLAVSGSGAVFVADTGNHRLCVLKDGVMYPFAGSGERGNADGVGKQATFAHPSGLAVASDGMVFVADCGNHRIRQVSPSGVVTTLAGSGEAGYRDGQGRHASFYNPCGIAIASDTLFISDYTNNCVRTVTRSGLVATLAKDPEAQLNSPYGIALHVSDLPCGGSETVVYVSSYHSHSIVAIRPDGSIRVVAGSGLARHTDGLGPSASFHAPNGLATDADGNLFVADSNNHCVRRVTPEGEVSTLAGDGCPGFTSSSFNSPCGLSLCTIPGRGAVLMVADRANSCVRVLPVDTLPPLRLLPSTMKDDIAQLLDGSLSEQCTGEATFEVQGRRIRAPKAILCARCLHFRTMFTSGMLESNCDVVQVPEADYIAYHALVDYLLCDELNQ
jgi:sugar lactone lactonase YvrE